tara:strand:+ start:89 stop:541 length:453 start_codon:yes stop_codon:yes gene_type:complete
MIIECIKCSKKFEVNSDLIPSDGRTIQCGSCGHVWFFKKQKIDFKKDNIKKDITEIPKKDPKIKTDKVEKIDRIINKKNKALIEYKKSSFTFLKFLRYIIVFVLSVGGLFLVLDTFKIPLSNFFPELELILYNFYEIFQDIFLFLKDLIK